MVSIRGFDNEKGIKIFNCRSQEITHTSIDEMSSFTNEHSDAMTQASRVTSIQSYWKITEDQIKTTEIQPCVPGAKTVRRVLNNCLHHKANTNIK